MSMDIEWQPPVQTNKPPPSLVQPHTASKTQYHLSQAFVQNFLCIYFIHLTDLRIAHIIESQIFFFSFISSIFHPLCFLRIWA